MYMFKQFIKALKEWAEQQKDIESVIVVGSYARGTNKASSDLDLVLITSNKSEMVESQAFVNFFGDVEDKQTEYYGACTSIRVWYKNGMEVEFGIVEPSWIAVPLDSGTHKVLRDGYRIILDKKDSFLNLNL